MAEETLTLPVAGHEYVVVQPPARIGRVIVDAFVIASARRNGNLPPAVSLRRHESRYGDGEHDMTVDALGEANHERMLDELSLPQLQRASMAAQLWIAMIGMSQDPDVARDAALRALDPQAWDEVHVEDGTDPKASTDAVSTTKKPASTSGTTSRKPSKKATPRTR